MATQWAGKLSLIAAVAVAAMALMAIAGLAISLTTRGAEATPNGKDEAAKVLAVLSASPKAIDDLPAAVESKAADMGESGLAVASTRNLGKSETASHWVAVDNSGNVCLIIQLAESGVSGSACRPVPDFVKYGLELSVEAPSGAGHEYAEAYLLPDGETLKAMPPGLRKLGGNLLVGDTRNLSKEARMPAALNPGFQLHLLTPVPDALTPVPDSK